jgi:hypothetical protein
MLVSALRQPMQQVCGEDLGVFVKVLREEVNLAIWQRQLPTSVSEFVTALLAQGESLGHSIVLELVSLDSASSLSGLLDGYSTLQAKRAFCRI